MKFKVKQPSGVGADEDLQVNNGSMSLLTVCSRFANLYVGRGGWSCGFHQGEHSVVWKSFTAIYGLSAYALTHRNHSSIFFNPTYSIGLPISCDYTSFGYLSVARSPLLPFIGNYP